MVLLHIFEVALLEVRVHVNGLKSHGAYGDALAAAYAGGIFDVSVFFLSEEQNACRTLDVDSIDVGSDKTHHRSAENYLLRGLDEAAALLDNVTEGSADAALEVVGLVDGRTADGEYTLVAGDAEIACLVDSVCSLSADNVAADACGQSAGLDFAIRYGLDLHFLCALGVLDLFGHDLNAVLCRIFGIEKLDGIHLVLLDAVVRLVQTAGYACKLNAPEKLFRMQLHSPMVAVEVRLAFGTVDDKSIDLSEAASDLESGGEHCAAHTDYACFAQTGKDRFRILQLLLSQWSQIRAGGVLVIVFDNDRHYHIAQRMGSGLDRYDLAGNGRMHGG